MAVKKYYEISRRERKKQRKKLMRLLPKQGYTEEDQLRIIDSLSGKTESGKEQAAQELSALIADGVGKEEILSCAKR
ncbi:MAG: hypothetical protein IJK89_09250 [Clostridia bacterium]|nr:hypothetical protein [Clostridia bacterium]